MSGIPQFTELLKFYNLVEHFLEHKQQKSDLDIFTFLKIHYASGDIKDADYNKDMKLPFKSVVKAEDAFPAVYPNIFNENSPAVLVFEKSINILYKPSHHISSLLFEIWQPPQISSFSFA